LLLLLLLLMLLFSPSFSLLALIGNNRDITCWLPQLINLIGNHSFLITFNLLWTRFFSRALSPILGCQNNTIVHVFGEKKNHLIAL
jgi:hypothetical protein